VKAITPRQLEMVRAIKRSVVERGYPPTLRELGETLGIRSTNGVADHLRWMRKKGLVEAADPGALSRSIRLTAVGDAAAGEVVPSPLGPVVVDVPVFSCVDPGHEEVSAERPTLRMSRHMLNGARDPFGLVLAGESGAMRRSGFAPGDVVIAESRQDIVGKLVLFLREGKASLRRYLWHGIEQRYEFQAVLSDDAPVFVAPDELHNTMILGAVVALWRTTT